MQCTNCHFENLPGSAVCGRCGTSMRLAEATIDVHPPRAGRTIRWLRRILPLGRMGAGLRDTWIAVRCRHIGALINDAPRQLPALLRIPIPGWSHFFLGQRLRGQLFLWSFLVLLVPGLLMLGTIWGSILVGLAFSVHASAALDIINQLSPEPSIRGQLARSVLVSVLLFTVLYLPLNHALRLVYEPMVMQWTMGSIHDGDVVLVNRRSYRASEPQLGDVVLYDVPNYRFGNQEGIYVEAGARLDRVLAGPGDDVRWQAGQLLVNEQPSALRPLNPGMLPDHLEFKVPPGHYLILPTTTPFLTKGMPEPVWTHLSYVPRGSILGHIFLRTHPLWRMGSL
ncbi:MAG: S26 family signal peptidase [Tepidisphaeraceae bacterium]|jgi:signal peptidase I